MNIDTFLTGFSKLFKSEKKRGKSKKILWMGGSTFRRRNMNTLTKTCEFRSSTKVVRA
jgi:hypothetical protein